jgi:hypothetical protein
MVDQNEAFVLLQNMQLDRSLSNDGQKERERDERLCERHKMKNKVNLYTTYLWLAGWHSPATTLTVNAK